MNIFGTMTEIIWIPAMIIFSWVHIKPHLDPHAIGLVDRVVVFVVIIVCGLALAAFIGASIGTIANKIVGVERT